MGILDDAKGAMEGLAEKAKDAIDSIGGDKVKDGVDAATDKIDDATGGKTADVTQKVDDAVASAVDKLEGQ